MLFENPITFQELVLLGSTALCGSMAFYFRSKIADLKQSSTMFEDAFDHLHEGYYRSSISGKQIYANKALVLLNGYTSREEMLNSINSIADEWYVNPDRRKEFQDILYRDGKVVNFVSEVYRHKSRERIWISENARVVHHPETMDALYYEGTVREITDEVASREAQNRLKKLSENLPAGLFQIIRDKNGKFTSPYLSASFEKLAGQRFVDIMNKPSSLLKFFHEEDRQNYIDQMAKSAESLTVLDICFRFSVDENSFAWLNIVATPEALDDGAIIWHGHLSDVTMQKLANRKIEKLAYYDSLTGLPKRFVAEDKIQSTIGSCNRRNEFAAILFLDLDNFKALNDTRGHGEGDELLSQVGKRLQGLVRASDLVARYGGDEFIIVIDNLGNNYIEAKDKAGSFAGKVLNCFKDGFELASGEHFTSPSIGLAIIDNNLPTLDELIKRADNAMYQAKKNGRNNYVIHGGNIVGTTVSLENYKRDLVGAIARNEFRLLFQPQLNADGQILGAEAFIRWMHPESGILSPAEFMPSAEKCGAMVDINNWVVNQAIDQLARWQTSKKTKHMRLAVNIGIQQFSTKDFADFLESSLFKARIERSHLTLELAETVMSRSIDRVKLKMLEIKKCGIRFALDDFGIGSSSLASLNILPFDQVKIDGMLISSIEVEPHTRSLIEGILGLANALKLETVAEHVGTSAQEKFLIERGCNIMQGYHYHPPMEIEKLDRLLEAQQLAPRLSLAG